MSKITDALNKLAKEKEAQKQTFAIKKESQPDRASEEEKKLPLEERFKNRTYIAKATDDSGIDPRIVTYFDPKAFISEQYRILRTNIQSNNLPRPLKAFVISSALHREGKTTTAVNLAVTMAQDLDKRVLLVDCDLRAGRVHKLLAINPAQGLSDILVNGTALEHAFHKSKINNLTILPRGDISHNPSELLGSKRMRRLLEELKSKFDYIILDSPPILPLTDSCVLSSQVDGVIFLVQAYKTPRGLVKHAQSLLQHVHAKIIGFVLTQTEQRVPGYMHRYYRETQRDRSDYIEEGAK